MNVVGLSEQIHQKSNFLCVGLDTDPVLLPEHLSKDAAGMLEFNCRIVESTIRHCVAYKINLAFYEALGTAGWEVFAETVKWIKSLSPSTFIIADAKRGDIGNTASRYARAFFEEAGVDALTIAPYMGEDSIRPFLEYKDKVSIVLGLTSNAGNQDFQMLSCEGRPLYEHVLERCMKWGNEEQLMFVIGATHPDLMTSLRSITKNYFWLVPGVGAQGGSIEQVWEGRNEKIGILINSSRDIIYNSKTINFASAAGDRAHALALQMSNLMAAE